MNYWKKYRRGLLAAVLGLSATTVLAESLLPSDVINKAKKFIVLEDQGSFAVGGTVIETPGEFNPIGFPAPPEGQTLHGDHAYVQYQVPVLARQYPLVMWHGGGQTGKTWETTADGRDGFNNIFVRRGFSTYVIDQPRRGRAANSTVPTASQALTQDQFFFNLYRLGEFPTFFSGVQFPQDEASLNQFFRQMVPDDPLVDDLDIDVAATTALFDKIGEATLITHSAAGGRGWLTRLASDNVKGIVNYEGVQYVFPEGEAPPPAPGPPQIEVPLDEFKKLTTIPIQVIFGDNIPQGDSPAIPTLEPWRQIFINAKHFVDTVNAHGGDAELLHLPEIGVTGNTHFPFSDLNNEEIADLLSDYLAEKGLDRRSTPFFR